MPKRFENAFILRFPFFLLLIVITDYAPFYLYCAEPKKHKSDLKGKIDSEKIQSACALSLSMFLH